MKILQLNNFYKNFQTKQIFVEIFQQSDLFVKFLSTHHIFVDIFYESNFWEHSSTNPFEWKFSNTENFLGN